MDGSPQTAASPGRTVAVILLAGAVLAALTTAVLVVAATLGQGGMAGTGNLVLVGAVVDLALCVTLAVSGTILLKARPSPPSEPPRPETRAATDPSSGEYMSVLETISEGVMTTDADGTILSVNEALAHGLGYEPADLVGQKPSLFRSRHHDDSFYASMWESLKDTGRWEGRIMNRHSSGEAVAQRLAISAIRDEEGETVRYVAVYDDDSPDGSWQDPLTGLADRSVFSDRLQVAIDHARRNEEILAVVYVQLGRFANVNESMGYLVGDRLLEKAAEKIQQSIHDRDTLCRWRGPVFAVLLPELHKPADAALVARRILSALDQPLDVLDHRIHTSPSLGISVFPEDGSDAPALLKSADLALANAREQGVNRYRFYTLDFEQNASERIGLEADLSRAVKQSEFELHYQPKIRISDGVMVGAEALMRWRHPSRGLVPPSTFIPVAEDTGLILPMSEWLLWTAFEQWKRWSTDGQLDGARLSVNISPTHFDHPGFMDKVQEVLKELKLDPKLVELEVTEGVFMKKAQDTVEKFQTLQDWGIRISLDDFGTGYSSLGYLTRFPVNILKIDRQFVRNIPENQDNSAIVASIIAMSEKLDMDVIAEGVEKNRQARYLGELGCNVLQGFLFSRPVPPAEFLELRKRRPSWLKSPS